jgi:hypothetical protein
MLEEQVAQEERGPLPDGDSTASPTDGNGTAEIDAQLEVEQTPCSIDLTTSMSTHREDGAEESTSDGSGEAEEA